VASPPVANARRPRASSLEKRDRILDVTEDLMLQEGYAAVSSRSVASRAGMPASLLHYHFATIDDLLVAVVRRRAEQSLARMAEVLDSPEPLLGWWGVAADPRGASLFVELLAAANHRPSVRAEVGEIARTMRRLQVERLHALLPDYGLDPAELPPALVAAAMQGIAFGIVQDQAAGYETSPDEARTGMHLLLTRLEDRRRERAR
jgi:AcrR family transcriptional regulator